MFSQPDQIISNIWQQFQLENPFDRIFSLGDTDINIRLIDQEILLSVSKNGENDKCTWQRWQQPFKKSSILFSPIVPNRPLSVKLDTPLTLTYSENLTVYIQIPVWISLQLVSGIHNIKLLEIPSTTLSGTWFGTLTEGQLCYSLASSAHTSMSLLEDQPNLTTCSLVLKNSSKENFIIDRVLLHTEYLSLFLDETRLWTDTASFTVFGKENDNQLRFSGKAPGFIKSAKLITKPSQVLKKPLTEMIFANIKDLALSGVYAKEG